MRTSDLTLVFQGAFRPYVTRDGEHALRNLRRTRQALPGACVILSTWEDAEVPRDLPVDVVVRSADPGPLAPLKLHDGKVNNVNRQLVSTLAGMAAVSTPYAAKLRTDCWLEHAGFLDFHAEQRGRDGGRERERILACSFFTLDPTVFERLPFHLSDWFQFGPIDALRRYWSAPPMDPGMDAITSCIPTRRAQPTSSASSAPGSRWSSTIAATMHKGSATAFRRI